MYWKSLPGISEKWDTYGFVNETEIRISTGITLVLGLLSLCLVLFKAEYSIPLIFVSLMVTDFFLKVFISPRLSIFGMFVRLFLKKWTEIWVGAVQKRFAWSIGILLSSLVLYCILLLGQYITPMEWPQMTAVSGILEATRNNIATGMLIVTPMNPTIIACLLCIIFMWSESVVGYCVGCSIYAWLVRKWWIRGHKNQNCVNGKCEI